MIEALRTQIPMPEAIAAMAGSRIPEHVLQAERDAVDADAHIRQLRGDHNRAGREAALFGLARYNPGLVVTHRGGAR